MLRKLLLVFLFSLPVTGGDEPVEVVILAGQSNMVGSAQVSELPGGKVNLPPNVETVIFAQAADKERRGKEFGPEVGFAQALGEANPDKRYLLIKWAIGGTSQGDWSPTWSLDDPHRSGKSMEVGSLYNRSLFEIKAALKGRKFSIRGILWMQGESDAKSPETAAIYDERMSELIAAFRRDLDAPDLRVIIGLINPDRPEKYVAVPQVRDAMQRLANADKLVSLVDTDGLSRKDDHVHYDLQGQLGLGKRFAEEWLRVTQ